MIKVFYRLEVTHILNEELREIHLKTILSHFLFFQSFDETKEKKRKTVQYIYIYKYKSSFVENKKRTNFTIGCSSLHVNKLTMSILMALSTRKNINTQR